MATFPAVPASGPSLHPKIQPPPTHRSALGFPSALDHIKCPNAQASIVEQLHQQVLQGRREGETFGSSRKNSAIHEAGHCVIGAATATAASGGMWAPPYRVSIWRHRGTGDHAEFWAGWTEVPPGSQPIALNMLADPLVDCVIYAMRMLAGVVAEAGFNRTEFSEYSALDERLMAGGVAKGLHSRGLFPTAEAAFEWLNQWTGKILDENKTAHHVIATALERKRKLLSHDLRPLLATVERIDFAELFTEPSTPRQRTARSH